MKETIYKRIFVIVLDSLGIGAMPDSEKFGDRDVDTFGHILDRMGTLEIPNLQKRNQQRQRYDDRTLGNDGNLYRKTI